MSKTNENTRIGNLEYIKGEDIDEIVFWYPNPHYNAQERLLKEGYVLNKDGSMTGNHCTIHKGCFKPKECRYTVADVEWNRQHDEFDVRSIGRRAFELEDQDYEDFKKILEHITKTN